ncbi:MAG: hypothetical protein ACRDZ6_11965 [Acidimicrobiales bacterium]
MKVDKLSVSFDPDLGDAVRAAAKQSGRGLSGWLAEAAAARLRAETLTRFLDGWEAEHGPLTAEELARLLRSVDVKAVDRRLGQDAGVLSGLAGRGDAVDATVVAIANAGDRIITSDAEDIGALVSASGSRSLSWPAEKASARGWDATGPRSGRADARSRRGASRRAGWLPRAGMPMRAR